MRAVTTGNFDGCHLGHQKIFNTLKKEAQKRNLAPLVLSFSPHTHSIFSDVSLLMSDEEKKSWLKRELGLDSDLLLFDEALRLLTPEQFIDQLADKWQASLWVVGYDHRFGKKGQGVPLEYKQYASTRGIEIIRVEADGVGEEIYSSSLIREYLTRGKVEDANRVLGHSYSLHGKVIHGDALGRELGFPTANLAIAANKHLPAFGVYAGYVDYEGHRYKAVCNIGQRPSVQGKETRVEIHILDFTKKIYGEELEFLLSLRIRKEIAFSSLDTLVEQITKDVQKTREILR